VDETSHTELVATLALGELDVSGGASHQSSFSLTWLAAIMASATARASRRVSVALVVVTGRRSPDQQQPGVRSLDQRTLHRLQQLGTLRLAPRLVADHQRRGNTMLPGTVARDHAEDPPSVRAHLPMAHLDPIGDRRPLRKPFIRRRATFA
jgi:hypothetical protein